MEDFVLKLADGTEIEFAAGSTITDLIGIYNTFAEVDTVWDKLTEENLKGAEFNGKVYENLSPVQVDFPSVAPAGKVEAHFRLAARSAVEILNEQILELQEAMAEIAG